MRPLRQVRNRSGFSLVEAMVAMTLVSVVLLALAPVLFGAVDRQRTDAIRLERNGVLTSEANRLLAVPFTSVAPASFTVAGPYHYSYAVDIAVTATATERLVKVKVTPTAPGVEADSVQFSRTQ